MLILILLISKTLPKKHGTHILFIQLENNSIYFFLFFRVLKWRNRLQGVYM